MPDVRVQAEPEVMQRLMGVPRITDSIRSHYGTAPNPDALAPAAGPAQTNTYMVELKE